MQDAEEAGSEWEAVGAALAHAAAAARLPSTQHAQQRLATTPWAAPASSSTTCPFHQSYIFLPIAQAGRDVASALRVPAVERAATLWTPVATLAAGASRARAEEAADAWNQCIDRAEVCVLLRELAKLASGEAQVGGGGAAARRHAVTAMGHLCSRFLTSHSPVRPS